MSYLGGAASVLRARSLWLWLFAAISAAFLACYYLTVRERNTYVFILLYGVFTWNAMLGYFAPDQQFIPIMRGALVIPIGIAVSVLFSERLWNYLTVGRLCVTQYVRIVAIVLILVVGGYVGDKLVGRAHQAYVAANS